MNNYKKLLGFGALCLGALFYLNSCGGAESGASSGATSLQSLPAATGPVGSGASSSLGIRSAAMGLRAVNPELFAAATGVTLQNFSSITWNSSRSSAMCEAGNQIRNLWRDASDPDKIGCYLGIMESTGLFQTPFDGTDKVYNLSSEGNDFKIKFVATKDDSGAINSFKMFECDANDSQRGYTSKTLNGGQVDIVAMYTFSESGFSGSNRTTVSGTFDSGSGTYTAKTLTGTTVNEQTSGTAWSNSETVTMTQGAGQITLSGYSSGTYNSNSYSKAQVAIVQTLNEDSIATFAIGDGAAKINYDWGSGANTGTIYWNGDTQANSSANDLETAIAAETIPTIESITTPSFGSGESWDCSDTSISTIDLNALDQSLFTACENQFGFSDNNWVDCSSTDVD